jgi:hypothetical protein
MRAHGEPNARSVFFLRSARGAFSAHTRRWGVQLDCARDRARGASCSHVAHPQTAQGQQHVQQQVLQSLGADAARQLESGSAGGERRAKQQMRPFSTHHAARRSVIT